MKKIDNILCGRISIFSRRQSSCAFTLLEIVLVLVIITLTLAAAAPSLNGFQSGRKTSDTATQFVAVTHYARSQAIADGTTYRVNIDALNDCYYVTMDDGTGKFVKASSNFAHTYNLPTGTRIESTLPLAAGTQYLEFQSTGQCDHATITFTGPNNGSILVACDSPFDIYHIVKPGGKK